MGGKSLSIKRYSIRLYDRDRDVVKYLSNCIDVNNTIIKLVRLAIELEKYDYLDENLNFVGD